MKNAFALFLMVLINITKAMWNNPGIAQKPGYFHLRRNECHCLSKVRHANAARMVFINRNSSDIITLKNPLRNVCYKFSISPKETLFLVKKMCLVY